jgi:hypothetical protein
MAANRTTCAVGRAHRLRPGMQSTCPFRWDDPPRAASSLTCTEPTQPQEQDTSNGTQAGPREAAAGNVRHRQRPAGEPTADHTVDEEARGGDRGAEPCPMADGSRMVGGRVRWFGAVAAVLAMLSIASIVLYPASLLLPVGRLLCMVWAIAARIVMSRATRG